MLFFNRRRKKRISSSIATRRKKATQPRSRQGQWLPSKAIPVLTVIGLLLGGLVYWDKAWDILSVIKQVIEEAAGSSNNNGGNRNDDNDNDNDSPNPTNSPPLPLKLYSWNIANFGESKNSKEIEFIAAQIKEADLVAIQEVSVMGAGAAAVARLADELNRKGNHWDYVLSQPTTGAGSERYAFLWKTAKMSLVGNVWNVEVQGLADKIDREPCLAKFRTNGRQFVIANFHALPVTKNPAQEIPHIEALHNVYQKENLIIAGDFNLSEKNKAFDGLKSKKYSPVLKNQRTSLRKTIEPNGNYLSQEYDNIFIENAPFVVLRSGINDFVPQVKTLARANEISDHLPIWCELQMH